jgi:hypothetical protein
VVNLRRNHAWLNDCNPIMAHAWRANTDVQFCSDKYGVAWYTVAYVTKNEMASNEFRHQLEELDRQQRTASNSFPMRTLLYKLSDATLGREVSLQECVYLIFGMQLMETSRASTTLNTLPRHRQDKFISAQQLKNSIEEHDSEEDAEQQQRLLTGLEPPPGKDLWTVYTNRPPNLESATPATYFSQYNETGAKRRKLAIINAVPFHAVDINNEDYCRSRIMLHTAWRSQQHLLPPGTSYVQHFAHLQQTNEHFRDVIQRENAHSNLEQEIRMPLEAAQTTSTSMPTSTTMTTNTAGNEDPEVKDAEEQLPDFYDATNSNSFLVASTGMHDGHNEDEFTVTDDLQRPGVIPAFPAHMYEEARNFVAQQKNAHAQRSRDLHGNLSAQPIHDDPRTGLDIHQLHAFHHCMRLYGESLNSERWKMQVIRNPEYSQHIITGTSIVLLH